MDVVNAGEKQVVRAAAGHARFHVGWLLGLVALTAVVGWFAWHGLDGVWPVLLWLIVGGLAGDVVSEASATVCAVREWAQLRRSGSYRAFVIALDAAEQQAQDAYWAARRAERAERAGRAGGPDGGAR